MRARKVKHYGSVLQVLNEAGCPICVLLKNLQAKLIQEEETTKFLHLCNTHAWAIAAVRKTESAARIFLSLLETRSRDAQHQQCSVCLRLEQEQILRSQELIAAFSEKSVREWLSERGTVCLPHGLELRAEAPDAVRQTIDHILETRTSELKCALRQLLADLSSESSWPSGLLGHVAEHLVSQRGVPWDSHPHRR